MSRKKVAIGIDLGTSKCCVGVVRDGRVDILENERTNKTTPSYVAFTDTERLVGEDAKDQATLNPTNTVFGVKRIIGREMGDPLVKEAMEKMPYTVMNNGETRIHVSYKDTEEFLLPQQISAMLLGKMKDVAELHLKTHVEEAVISVPASFTNAQRQATKDAAAIAGLKVLALINEPTAAAIAYQVNRRNPSEENIAIVDFGAGNLNVAVVNVGKRRVCVKAVCGSAVIGGNDITEALMKHVAGKFEEKYGKKLPEGGAMTERLRSCCEKLKKILSLLPKVQDRLDSFGDDAILPVAIQREDFNSMIPSEVQISLKNCCIRITQSSGLPMEEIKSVLLVGGSSRIPQFQVWLEEIFGKNSLDKSVNPDEAVACGAAYYAALLSKDNELEDIIVEDRVQNDFCFAIKGNSDLQRVFGQHSSATSRVFPFNEQSPFNERTRNETFELYEELSGQKNPHRLIGTLCLDDEFRQAVRLINDVTFAIDRCGIFNVVVQLKPNHVFSDVLKNYGCQLSDQVLQDSIEKERQFRRDDQDETERVKGLSDLEALCFSLQSVVGDNKIKDLFPELVKRIRDKATENIHWLDITPMVPKAECVKRQNTLGKLKTELEIRIKRFEKNESDRQTAVTNLKSYCSHIKTSLSAAMTGETEMASALNELLEQTIEWLKNVEYPSKVDCDNRKDSLKTVQGEFEKKLELKQREDDRRAAVVDLQNYCSKVQAMKFDGKEFKFLQYRGRTLKEEASKCSKYLDGTEVPSKEDCDSWKMKLEKLVRDLEDQVERTTALQRESERLDAVSILRSRCFDLESLTNRFNKGNTEALALASLASTEAREIRQWLHGHRTKEERNAKQEIIENYEKTLNSYMKEFDQKLLLTDKEKERLDCVKSLETRWLYVKTTLLIDVTKKQEPALCDQIIGKKNVLCTILENHASFSKKDYEKKLASFDTSVGTLRNKMKRPLK